MQSSINGREKIEVKIPTSLVIDSFTVPFFVYFFRYFLSFFPQEELKLYQRRFAEAKEEKTNSKEPVKDSQTEERQELHATNHVTKVRERKRRRALFTVSNKLDIAPGQKDEETSWRLLKYRERKEVKITGMF